MTETTIADPLSEKASGYAWYALGVLSVVYMINFIDRQILSILAEDIRHDLNLNDADLGFLYGTSFAIFYTIFGIPLGRMADRWYRTRLMAIGLAFWSAMTALSGLATSYTQLAIARIGVGIGEASASPAAFSLLADYFPKRQRALVMSIYSAGLYVGLGLALPLGGYIALNWDTMYAGGGAPFGLVGWQATFIAVGLPGIALAIVVMLLKEPQRGEADGLPAPIVQPGAWSGLLKDMASIIPPFTLWQVRKFNGGLRTNILGGLSIAVAAAILIWLTADTAQWLAYSIGCYAIMSWVQSLRETDRATFALIWGTPAILLCLLGFGSLAYYSNAYNFWVAPFAIRNFGISKEIVGLSLGIPGAIASAIGVIAGGKISDVWKSRDPRGRIFVGLLSATFPAPLIAAMFTIADWEAYVILNPFVCFFGTMWLGSCVAIYQDLVLPRMRGVVGATYILGSTMVGLALGPYVTGKVATVTGSLSTGILSLLVIFPVAIVALIGVCKLAPAAEASKIDRARAVGEPI